MVTPQNIARVGLCFVRLNFLVTVIGVRDLGYFLRQLFGCLESCLIGTLKYLPTNGNATFDAE